MIASKNLIIVDKLLLKSGNTAIITSIEIEKYEKEETTYNFEVEDYHIYYVGDSEVLVHNAYTKIYLKTLNILIK